MGPRDQEINESSCTEIAGRSPSRDEESTLLSSPSSTSGCSKRVTSGAGLVHMFVQVVCGRAVLITLILLLATTVLLQHIDLEDTTRPSLYHQGGEPDTILGLKKSSAGKSSRRKAKHTTRRLVIMLAHSFSSVSFCSRYTLFSSSLSLSLLHTHD
jgi:hypothetical protein